MRRQSIVIVTDRRLFPINEGIRARIVTLIRSLRELGFAIIPVGRRPPRLRDAIHTRRLVDRLVFVAAAGFRPGSPSAYDCMPFFEPLKSVVDRFDPVAVIAEHIWMAPCLDVVQNGALRLVDTHDLMHARRRRKSSGVPLAASTEIGL